MNFIEELTSKVSEITQQTIASDVIVDAYRDLYTLDHDLPDRQSIVDCVQEARNQPKCDKTLITPLPILSLAHLSRPNRIQSYRTDDLQKISTVQVFTGLFYNKNLNSVMIEAHACLKDSDKTAKNYSEMSNPGAEEQDYFVPSLFIPMPYALPKRQATVVLPSQPPCIVYQWNHSLVLVNHRGGIIEITPKCS
jgi:hypothetical protein